MTRARATALLAAAFLAVIPTAAVRAGGDTPDLSGHWTLNTKLSRIPREVGFGMDLFTAGNAPTVGGVNESPAAIRYQESEGESKRREMLVDEVRTPPSNVSISQSSDEVIVTNEGGRPRVFHPNGRDEVQDIGSVAIVTTSRWDGTGLEVRYGISRGRELRYTYSRIDNPPQLVVQVRFIERGGKDVVTLVYEPSQPGEPHPVPPAAAGGAGDATRTGTPPAGAAPRQPAQMPATVPASELERLNPASPAGQPGAGGTSEPGKGPDAGLRGLTTLGVVVEDLNQQAMACGLSQPAIEAATVKSLTDAGFKVQRHADEDTYLYVQVITTSGSGGLCVSRYDVFLYTNTVTSLPYQSGTNLVQVELLHSGGIAGGRIGTHVDAVMGPVKKAVDEFIGRIRAANR
jgi:hypothetical protein